MALIPSAETTWLTVLSEPDWRCRQCSALAPRSQPNQGCYRGIKHSGQDLTRLLHGAMGFFFSIGFSDRRQGAIGITTARRFTDVILN